MSNAYFRFNRFLERHMPTGLYTRSLIIVIAPIVLLQTIMAGIILDRHWDNVTKVLGRSLAREIGLVTDLYDRSNKSEAAIKDIELIANKRLKLGLEITRGNTLPAPIDRTLYSLVDDKMTKYLERETGRPFWINSTAQNGKVEIRVEVEKGLIFRILTDEERAYAANTGMLLAGMFLSSLVLLLIAVIFLRKQITPIVELANAAKSFGMGREVTEFRPRGAREVREAGLAFVDMKSRIARHVEQRTAMLAGVSHDLRTILTRFKLELVLIGDSPEVEAMKKDVDEMARMLEAYLAFARGDSGEQSAPTDMGAFLEELKTDTERNGHKSSVHFHGHPIVTVRPAAFKRCLANLVSNAARYAPSISITGHRDHRWLIVTVDDDGPGIAPHLREEVFKPFLRLDDARNQDEGGTGLGLAIARDIARLHGGDIILSDSPLGGLRATVRVPV